VEVPRWSGWECGVISLRASTTCGDVENLFGVFTPHADRRRLTPLPLRIATSFQRRRTHETWSSKKRLGVANLWRWFMVLMRVDGASAFGFSAVTLDQDGKKNSICGKL
jgi:hypothetical protein